MSKYDLVIVGIFYDGYYDIWEDFLELFSLKWENCPYPLYIVNNTKELTFGKKYDVQVIHAGKGAEYSQKVQKAINEIYADHYLFLLEDFLIEFNLKTDPLKDIIDYMSKNEVHYYRMQIPEFIDKKISTLDGPVNIKQSDEYTVTCQPSIWKRDFIQRCIGNTNYNAWVFEGIYCYSQYAHSKEFLDKCRVDYRNVLGIRHLALQGKILPTVYQDFVNNGYVFKNKREILTGVEWRKCLMKVRLKNTVPLKLQKMIKRIVKNNSVVERYKKEILQEMRNLGID